MDVILPPHLLSMPIVTRSRMAMYEGFIALAWIDGPMHEANRARLTEMFLQNRFLAEDQRQKLLDRLNDKIELEDVWHSITEAQDRAHLLDHAGLIFHRDGNYSAREREIYQTFLARHLESLRATALGPDSQITHSKF